MRSFIFVSVIPINAMLVLLVALLASSLVQAHVVLLDPVPRTNEDFLTQVGWEPTADLEFPAIVWDYGDDLEADQVDGRDSEVLDVMDFGEEFNVDVQTSTDSEVQLCMNPRGFADTGCNSFTSPVTVTFLLMSDVASVVILTLGQMVAD